MAGLKVAGVAAVGFALLCSASVAQTVADDVVPPAANVDLPACAGLGPVIAFRTRTLPALGQEVEVEVGQPLVDAIPIQIQAGALALRSPVTFGGRVLFNAFDVTVPAGALRSNGAGGHIPAEYEFKYRSESRPRSGFSRPNVWLEAAQDGHGLVGVVEVAGGRRFPIAASDFEISECYLTTSDVRRQLLYAGTSRGIVTLEYRELSRNMLRPAFTQRLDYDLTESDLIGFRGARLRIISATNVGIRYVVVQPFAE